MTTPLASVDHPDASYVNLFNPLSPIMGGGDKYPKFMLNMMPRHDRAAWLISKAGAVSLLAAGLFGGYRLLQHVNKVSDIAKKDDPADGMSSDIGTTFNVPFTGSKDQKKKNGIIRMSP